MVGFTAQMHGHACDPAGKLYVTGAVSRSKIRDLLMYKICKVC